MLYRRLGHTDLEVSVICLGTMTWGEQNTEAEAHQQLDTAVDAGVNFIDTAEMYPIPPQAKTYGLTETYLGNWLKSRKLRDQLIIASKVAGPAEWLPHIRGGELRLDRKNIISALDGSLQRLQTDHIDLYQLHWPDRKTNFFGKLGYAHDAEAQSVPLQESLEVLGELVAAGKIRYIGLSNETPWGIMHCLQLAEGSRLPRIVSVQNPYNLLNRTFEIGNAEISHREQVGLLAYSPLGFGVLSGKYLDGARPEGTRLALYEHYRRYSKPNAQAAVALYVDIARRHGLLPSQMALAYVNSRTFLTSTIIGATTLEQLHSNLDSINLALSHEVLEAIEGVHEAFPNPSP